MRDMSQSGASVRMVSHKCEKKRKESVGIITFCSMAVALLIHTSKSLFPSMNLPAVISKGIRISIKFLSRQSSSYGMKLLCSTIDMPRMQLRLVELEI